MRSSPPPSPAFVAAFLAKAGPGAILPFDEFMALALYDPALGYYTRDRVRVGRTAGTDFYTATSSGKIFGELVAAAATRLLTAAGLDPRDHRFLELGAEPGRCALDGVSHSFADVDAIRVGDRPHIEGRCVIFSNELFDAQPLRRFVRNGDTWRERGVTWDGSSLREILLATPVCAPWLPDEAPEGYCFDAPRAAVDLASTIAHQPWTGLFLAFDYGKSFAELASATPQGTARAYHQHRQSNDLLAQPGEQDLTGHVCWDWLAAALTTARFRPPAVESQEAFFITHAAEFLAAAFANEAAHLSQRKLALMQLLHPGNMGQKFQVLHATRGEV